MWGWKGVLITVFLPLVLGCSDSEKTARTTLEKFAASLETQLPSLISEYDEDDGRVTKLSAPLKWTFDRASRRDSAYEGTVGFGMHVTSADGRESEITVLSHYAYEGGQWVCKKYEMTSGENEPVKIVGEDLRNSADISKLASALVNVE